MIERVGSFKIRHRKTCQSSLFKLAGSRRVVRILPEHWYRLYGGMAALIAGIPPLFEHPKRHPKWLVQWCAAVKETHHRYGFAVRSR